MKTMKYFRENEINSMKDIVSNMELYQENSENGLVILLNSAWGTGKTTFIKDFIDSIAGSSDLELFGLYNAYEFDCYENAYIPFFSWVAEKIKIEEKINSLVMSASVGVSVASATFLVSLVRSIVKNKIGVDFDTVAQDMEKSIGIFNDDYYKKYKDFIKHKADIKDKVANYCDSKKHIFIIDELDRCKPNFAMETLEIIKHFFDIKNCIFIIAVDKEQLEETAKVIYGSVNSEKYFSKLFDYQFNLLPLTIIDVVDISEHPEYKAIVQKASEVFKKLHISLRDGKKILNELLTKGKNWTLLQKSFMLFLFILKYTDLSFYNAIVSGNYLKYKNIIDEQLNTELSRYKNVLNSEIYKQHTYDFVLQCISYSFDKSIYTLQDGNTNKIVNDTLVSCNDMSDILCRYVPIYMSSEMVSDSLISLVS